MKEYLYSLVEDLQNEEEGKFKASLCKNNLSFHILVLEKGMFIVQ